MNKIMEFTGNNTLLVVALMISFFMVIFTELRRKASGLVNVEPTDAVKLMNNDAIVIDLRSAATYALGHIVNAKNIPSEGSKLRTHDHFIDLALERIKFANLLYNG